MANHNYVRGVRASNAEGILSGKTKTPGVRIEFKIGDNVYTYESYFSGASKALEACELCGMSPDKIAEGDFSGFDTNRVTLAVKPDSYEVAFINAHEQSKMSAEDSTDFKSKMRAFMGKPSASAQDAGPPPPAVEESSASEQASDDDIPF